MIPSSCFKEREKGPKKRKTERKEKKGVRGGEEMEEAVKQSLGRRESLSFAGWLANGR